MYANRMENSPDDGGCSSAALMIADMIAAFCGCCFCFCSLVLMLMLMLNLNDEFFPVDAEFG